MDARSSRPALVVLITLGGRERTTTELYDDVGYPELVRCGLVPYKAFRATLAALEREGLVSGRPDEDGATLWRRTERGDGLAARYSAA